jgi:hypothetical protein
MLTPPLMTHAYRYVCGLGEIIQYRQCPFQRILPLLERGGLATDETITPKEKEQ